MSINFTKEKIGEKFGYSLIQENSEEKNQVLWITKNTFKSEESIIQISNISMVTIMEKPKPAPFGYIIIFLIGASLLAYGSSDNNVLSYFGAILGLILLFITSWSFKNSYLSKNNKYLAINLNSGAYVYYYSEDIMFIQKALDAIIDCINNNKATIINFKDCTIQDSTIVGGDIVISGQDWKVLEEFFNDVLHRLDSNSHEYFVAEKAKECTRKKDKEGLKSILENNISAFKNGIFSSMLTTVVIEILKKFIGV